MVSLPSRLSRGSPGKGGVDVLLVDDVAERMEESEFLDRVVRFRPELVLMEVSTIAIDVDMGVVRETRRLLGERALIALCGLHAFMKEPGFKSVHFDDDAYNTIFTGFSSLLSRTR